MFEPALPFELRAFSGGLGERFVARGPLAPVGQRTVEPELDLDAAALGVAQLGIDVLMTFPQPPNALADFTIGIGQISFS